MPKTEGNRRSQYIREDIFQHKQAAVGLPIEPYYCCTSVGLLLCFHPVPLRRLPDAQVHTPDGADG